MKRSTIYALCADGQLGHLRIGRGRGTIRIDQADIDAYRKIARVEPRPRLSREERAPDFGYVYKHIKPQV
ncbi:hypothetical protein [Singulisphaera sp. PoT]|uniref:hypothetical protein n=1 Tax=Singulisphaera sp. PoT TaxID=3411797 RepID=UPI003BF49B3F